MAWRLRIVGDVSGSNMAEVYKSISSRHKAFCDFYHLTLIGTRHITTVEHLAGMEMRRWSRHNLGRHSVLWSVNNANGH